LTLRTDMYVEFAARLEQAMAAKSIKHSPTVLGNLFNSVFDGRAVTPHTARNWMLGKSMPTQEKLVVLAELLDTSAEQLRYGRHSEKTLMISNADGSETELNVSQQQLVRKYIMLSASQQRLVSDLVDEISG
jgi:hypothetical protein